MPTKAKTLKDFADSNDRETITRNKIRAGIAAMVKIGSEHHENERDFCALAGVSSNHLPDFRDEFQKHIALVPGMSGKTARYVWFGDSKKVPEKFRYTPEKANG